MIVLPYKSSTKYKNHNEARMNGSGKCCSQDTLKSNLFFFLSVENSNNLIAINPHRTMDKNTNLVLFGDDKH